ncbi:11133_t:CDS:2, partial [Dentiscutata erythropus]
KFIPQKTSIILDKMKTLVIPITEIKKERLKEINDHIEGYPLMSEKLKTGLYWLSGTMAALVIIIVVSVFYTSVGSAAAASFASSQSYKPFSTTGAAAGSVIVEVLIFGLTYFAKYMIDQKSQELAKNFKNNLKPLLTQYNNKDNPTANWRFVWRKVLSHYSIEGTAGANGNIKGKSVPQFVEQAEIVLELNDALSELTADTVTVNKEVSKIQEEKSITTVTTIQ